MSKYTEAIADIVDIICESNTTKPTMVVFEQEKQSLWTAVEALQIADRLEQAQEFAYYDKEKIHTKCCWCICDENGSDCRSRYKEECDAIDIFYEAYTQALEDVRGDNNGND